MLVDTTASRFHVGERWRYRTRPREEDSLLTVLKVEAHPRLGVIVHVSVDGLRIKNPHAPTGFSRKVGHMPMAEQALEGSVTALVKTEADLPAFAEGYRLWRSGFDEGKAGTFTCSVADALGHMESILGE